MRRSSFIGAAGAAFTFAFAPPAFAILYEGRPDLALTAALVAAGGGPEKFSSKKVFGELAGAQASAEAEKLTQQFGAAAIANTFDVFDYAVNDTLRIATAKQISLPAPVPDPTDARALALALYGAGVSGSGRWDVGFMLEHLISHPIHHAIMHDMDDKFGQKNNASFHIVLSQLMYDLSRIYTADVPAARTVQPNDAPEMFT